MSVVVITTSIVCSHSPPHQLRYKQRYHSFPANNKRDMLLRYFTQNLILASRRVCANRYNPSNVLRPLPSTVKKSIIIYPFIGNMFRSFTTNPKDEEKKGDRGKQRFQEAMDFVEGYLNSPYETLLKMLETPVPDPDEATPEKPVRELTWWEALKKADRKRRKQEAKKLLKKEEAAKSLENKPEVADEIIDEADIDDELLEDEAEDNTKAGGKRKASGLMDDENFGDEDEDEDGMDIDEDFDDDGDEEQFDDDNEFGDDEDFDEDEEDFDEHDGVNNDEIMDLMRKENDFLERENFDPAKAADESKTKSEQSETYTPIQRRIAQQNMKDLVRLLKQIKEAAENGEIPIHPEDVYNQRAARHAMNRIKARLAELYVSDPYRFNELVAKYQTLAPGLVEKLTQDNFWTIYNPFLVGATIREIKKELQMFEDERAYYEQFKGAPVMDKGDNDIIFPTDLIPGASTVRVKLGGNASRNQNRGRPSGCLFCSEVRHIYPLEPMNVPLLRSFLSAEGRILPRKATGLCKKHQKRMSRTVKWARHLGIFSYKRGFEIFDPMLSTGPTPEILDPFTRIPFDTKKRRGSSASF